MDLQNRDYRVLHIVANFPDGNFQQNTTDAVKNLIEATSESLSHFIVSIARISDPRKESVTRKKGMLSISYFGLPAAIGQSFFLYRLARRIEKELVEIGIEFDIIHGHKLTVEAFVACFLTLKLKKPFVCTVRGLTDGRILHWRPDRRGLYANVMKKTSIVFLPAPWTKNLIEQYLEPRNQEWHQSINFSILPNIVHFSQVNKEINSIRESKFVTVFREGHGKRKGFQELLTALVAAQKKQKKIFLDVIGCGLTSNEAGLVKKFGLSEQVSFLGKLDNSETVRRLAHYRGFVLPTRKDTFGMVYTEALLAGVPILYSANTGIDGHLNNLDVGVRVDPFSQNSINKGILVFDEQAEYLRSRLEISINEGRLDFFRKSFIASNYEKAIRRCLENG